MRDLTKINRHRRLPNVLNTSIGIIKYDGAFEVKSPVDGWAMLVLCSTSHGWDHVSVSRRDRCPTWTEMAYIKKEFFKNIEVVMQLHVSSEDHINFEPNCLHLWRPRNGKIPLPPKEMV